MVHVSYLKSEQNYPPRPYREGTPASMGPCSASGAARSFARTAAHGKPSAWASLHPRATSRTKHATTSRSQRWLPWGREAAIPPQCGRSARAPKCGPQLRLRL